MLGFEGGQAPLFCSSSAEAAVNNTDHLARLRSDKALSVSPWLGVLWSCLLAYSLSLLILLPVASKCQNLPLLSQATQTRQWAGVSS